jgi:hypothetical protein
MNRDHPITVTIVIRVTTLPVQFYSSAPVRALQSSDSSFQISICERRGVGGAGEYRGWGRRDVNGEGR